MHCNDKRVARRISVEERNLISACVSKGYRCNQIVNVVNLLSENTENPRTLAAIKSYVYKNYGSQKNVGEISNSEIVNLFRREIC